METCKEYFLCGGVLFFLLTKATLPNGTSRDHRNGVKDEHAEPILMQDLIYTFTGSRNYGAQKETSKYKECQIEGGVNIPFNDITKCTTYANLVTQNYAAALNRMDEFVLWHIDPEMKVWFVKAVLEIIENDKGIKNTDALFIRPDGTAVTKGKIQAEESYDFSAFLVGILHYILSERREKNGLGIPTLDAIGEKKNRKPRRYTGNLGEAVTRKIEVLFLQRRAVAVEDGFTDGAVEVMNNHPEPDSVLDQSDEQIKENIAKSISTLASVMEADKHVLADEIRRNSRKDDSTYQTEIPDSENVAASGASKDKETTIIQQQTNVIQNGENNVNVTNNGTINFNF